LLEYKRQQAYGVEKPSDIALVLLHEVYDLHHMLHQIENHPEDTQASTIEAKTAIGDSLAMLQEICTFLKVKLPDLWMTGCQRSAQRCQERLNAD
jgi:uncharacterized membrane protein